MLRWIRFIALILTIQVTSAQTDFAPSLVLSQDEEIVTITYNVVTEAEFTSDNLRAIYEFNGQTGDIIIIRVYGSVVAEVMLFSPDGLELDRQLPVYGPEMTIGWRTLTENGTYQIVIQGALEGTYSVSVGLREAPALALNTTGITQQDYFTLHVLEMDYVFSGNSGQIVTIAVDSNEFDTLLTLIAPDRSVIAEDDDNGGNLNALLWEFALPQTGTYHIIVRRYMDRGSGTFYVRLRDADDPNRINFGEIHEVGVSGESQTASLLIFRANGSDVVAIRTDDPAENVIIRLEDPRGEVIRDSSSSDPYSMMDRVVLSSDGNYRLSIGPTEDAIESVDINLWVELLGTMSLDNSGQIPLTLHISDKSPVATFSFSYDNTAVGGIGRISIDQAKTGQSFRLTFLAEGEVIAQIEFAEMLGIGSLATEFNFPLQSVAQSIQLEFLGEGTAFFTISATTIYGIG